jgi:hypothetical protein
MNIIECVLYEYVLPFATSGACVQLFAVLYCGRVNNMGIGPEQNDDALRETFCNVR